MLVNTSFNVRGEPIVCTPQDAFRCFMGTEIEVLAVGNCYLRKEHQSPALKQNDIEQFLNFIDKYALSSTRTRPSGDDARLPA